MMITHTWIDQYSDTYFGASLKNAAAAAVQFDCGNADEIPIGKGVEFAEARAPFPVTLLQFETPASPLKSHVLVLWEEVSDSDIVITCADKARTDKQWRTALPTSVTRNDDGSFHYEKIGYADTSHSVQAAHAMALNLFYILGCSNVATNDNNAPKALNKKRAKKGKTLISEYKTLLLKLDAQNENNPHQGGTHASPRVHLRRGHVRNLKTGKRVWVQACVVGSKHGVITKDYRIAPSCAV